MKLPRNLSGRGLAEALRSQGYQIARQTGSHIRLVTIRNGMSREYLINSLFK